MNKKQLHFFLLNKGMEAVVSDSVSGSLQGLCFYFILHDILQSCIEKGHIVELS